MSDELSVALWATDMALAPSSAAQFLDFARAQGERARDAGATLLVMPEYVCEAWLTYADPQLPETDEIAWMAEQARDILPALAAMARELDLAVLAGTVPSRSEPGGFRNRAHLFLPDGRVHRQDKLSLTPDERDPKAWMLEPGDRLGVVSWRGLRLAVVVCLDIEQPALAARLQGLDLDLVLVPSDTGLASGHARVFGCAKARAVELYCTVAAVGGVGAIPLSPTRPNVAGAAVYLPCEAAFGCSGVLADTGPRSAGQGSDDLLIVSDIPVGRIRTERSRGGEVWLGPWSADWLRIDEAEPRPEPPLPAREPQARISTR
jgi:predicted amidohydrolase